MFANGQSRFARIAYIRFDPGKEAELVKVWQEQIVPRVKSEKGCLSVELFKMADGSNRHAYMTHWDCQENADAHFNYPHSAELNAAIKPFLLERTDLHNFHILDSQVV